MSDRLAIRNCKQKSPAREQETEKLKESREWEKERKKEAQHEHVKLFEINPSCWIKIKGPHVSLFFVI